MSRSTTDSVRRRLHLDGSGRTPDDYPSSSLRGCRDRKPRERCRVERRADRDEREA